MFDYLGLTFLTAIVVQITIAASFNPSLDDPNKKEKPAAFTFADTKYYHRFANGDQHEYTPAGQEDLDKWTDMVTTHRYPKAKDGDGLAGIANSVLENYKAHKAMVVKTDSVPRTKEKPAEHLIAVLFPRPEFIEAVFARFRLQDGISVAGIYSHRVYGKAAGNDMSAWLQKNGPQIEKRLMAWESIPSPPAKK